MELIYIGEKFYKESNTSMSSIYDIAGNRQDWGFVQIALERGETIHIRQALPSEIKTYEQKLVEFKRYWKEIL